VQRRRDARLVRDIRTRPRMPKRQRKGGKRSRWTTGVTFRRSSFRGSRSSAVCSELMMPWKPDSKAG
jgi:hypothetical protein